MTKISSLNKWKKLKGIALKVGVQVVSHTWACTRSSTTELLFNF